MRLKQIAMMAKYACYVLGARWSDAQPGEQGKMHLPDPKMQHLALALQR